MPPTLLLADDSLTIRRVIELTFADEGVRVVAVADGREAIDRITAEPPDVILADIGMPEHDGYEVAAFVKRTPHLAHIPVLLLTGAFEPVDQARARSVGADGVLVKPFAPQLVIARVRVLLAGAGKTRPSPAADAGAAAASAPASEPIQPAAASAKADDYLDRLDAAFAAMSASPRPIGAPPAPSPGDGDRRSGPGWSPEVVTNSGALVTATGAAPQHPPSPVAPPGAAGGVPSLADAFVALLAAERGRPLSDSPNLPAVALSDATIDQIASRVIARLGDESMRQAVLDAAERLVREEIDRIKSRQQRAAGGA